MPAWSAGGVAEWYAQRLLTGSDHNATRNFHYKTYGQGLLVRSVWGHVQGGVMGPRQVGGALQEVWSQVCAFYVQALRWLDKLEVSCKVELQ